MQHVGSKHDVIAVGVEALFDRVLLYVQGKVFDAPIAVTEPRLRLGEESGRYVRVRVVEPTFRKLGQYGRGS